MNATYVDVLASLLSFVGGALLSVDSVIAARRVRTGAGAAAFHENQRTVGFRGIFTDKDGKPLGTPEEINLWLVRGSQNRAIGGFALMTVGFLLDGLTAWLQG
jgi:hypothetical protein